MGDGGVVGGCRFFGPAEATEEVGAGGVEQVISGQVALVQRVELVEGGGGACDLGQGDAAVEGDDRGGGDGQELVVEGEDLAPVGGGGHRGVGVDGGDRGLELVGAGAVAAQAGPDQVVAFGDQGPVPAVAVLVGQADQGAVGGGAGRAPGLGEQEQGQQAEHLGLVGHQLGQQGGQPERFGAQLGADQGVTDGNRTTTEPYICPDQIEWRNGRLRIDAGKDQYP